MYNPTCNSSTSYPPEAWTVGVGGRVTVWDFCMTRNWRGYIPQSRHKPRVWPSQVGVLCKFLWHKDAQPSPESRVAWPLMPPRPFLEFTGEADSPHHHPCRQTAGSCHQRSAEILVRNKPTGLTGEADRCYLQSLFKSQYARHLEHSKTVRLPLREEKSGLGDTEVNTLQEAPSRPLVQQSQAACRKEVPDTSCRCTHRCQLPAVARHAFERGVIQAQVKTQPILRAT